MFYSDKIPAAIKGSHMPALAIMSDRLIWAEQRLTWHTCTLSIQPQHGENVLIIVFCHNNL